MAAANSETLVAKDAAVRFGMVSVQLPAHPESWTLAQRFEAEFARASAIGARLAASGQRIMSGLPPNAGPEETVLYMLQCQNAALELSAAVLQVA